MKRFCIPVAVLAMMVGCQENEGDTTPKSSASSSSVNKTSAEKSAKSDSSVTAKSGTGTGSAAAGTGTGTAAAAKPLEYQEVRVGDRLYVVGSKEAAEKAQAGKLEKPVRAIGVSAPENVKVYFEEANQAALEAEYARRHPG